MYPIDGASREQLDSIADTLNALGTDNSDEIVLNDTSSVFIGLMDEKTASSLSDMNSAVRLFIPICTYFIFYLAYISLRSKLSNLIRVLILILQISKYQLQIATLKTTPSLGNEISSRSQQNLS